MDALVPICLLPLGQLLFVFVVSHQELMRLQFNRGNWNAALTFASPIISVKTCVMPFFLFNRYIKHATCWSRQEMAPIAFVDLRQRAQLRPTLSSTSWITVSLLFSFIVACRCEPRAGNGLLEAIYLRSWHEKRTFAEKSPQQHGLLGKYRPTTVCFIFFITYWPTVSGQCCGRPLERLKDWFINSEIRICEWSDLCCSQGCPKSTATVYDIYCHYHSILLQIDSWFSGNPYPIMIVCPWLK